MSAEQSSSVPTSNSPPDCESQGGGGIAIEVFAEANRGGRKHMEDVLAIELETGERGQAFVGILDGHGGKEAALYAKERLWDNIKSFQGFHTSESERVKEAIVEGFKKTHSDMWTVRGEEFGVCGMNNLLATVNVPLFIYQSAVCHLLTYSSAFGRETTCLPLPDVTIDVTVLYHGCINTVLPQLV